MTQLDAGALRADLKGGRYNVSARGVDKSYMYFSGPVSLALPVAPRCETDVTLELKVEVLRCCEADKCRYVGSRHIPSAQ